MEPSRPPAARIAELDALRGVAALGVVLFHLSLLDPAAGPGFAVGASGVDLFFVISGFVILMTLERTRDWREFAIGRFSRLYPAYWACVTLAALAALPRLGARALAWDYAANLTMFQLYLGAPDLDGSYWTLIIEMLFYLGMLAVYLAGRLEALETLGAGCLALLFVYDSASFKGHLPGLYAFLSQWVPIVHHFPLFLAGIAFYRIRTRGGSAWRYALLVACYLCQRRLYWDGGVIRFYLGWQAYQAAIAAYFLLFLLQVRGRLGFLANPATLWLGRISFCLYLCHQSLARDWLVPQMRSQWGWGFWPASGLTLVCVLALADALSRYVERPALRWIRGGSPMSKGSPPRRIVAVPGDS